MLEPLLLEQRAREVLGVSEKASRAKIRYAYWKLARAYHPDLGPDDPSRHAKFIAVAEAYDILTKRSSPARRYSLRRKPIHLPRVLGEQEYWRWWLERYADLL
jgi:curved DNA-binding protein CbpA